MCHFPGTLVLSDITVDKQQWPQENNVPQLERVEIKSGENVSAKYFV